MYYAYEYDLCGYDPCGTKPEIATLGDINATASTAGMDSMADYHNYPLCGTH